MTKLDAFLSMLSPSPSHLLQNNLVHIDFDQNSPHIIVWEMVCYYLRMIQLWLPLPSAYKDQLAVALHRWSYKYQYHRNQQVRM